MIYEAHMYNGDVVEIEVEFDGTENITYFADHLYEEPEYGIFIDDNGLRHPAMPLSVYENGTPYWSGANSNDYESYEHFDAWLVSCIDEYYDCDTPVITFNDDITPWR